MEKINLKDKMWIKELYKNYESLDKKEVILCGFIRNLRSSKSIAFISLNDGTLNISYCLCSFLSLDSPINPMLLFNIIEFLISNMLNNDSISLVLSTTSCSMLIFNFPFSPYNKNILSN